MRNEQVIRLWLNGAATASTSNGNLSIRDGRLYSYNLMIGDRKGLQVRIYNYTSSGSYYSQTTSCHVGLALGYAGVFAILMDPMDELYESVNDEMDKLSDKLQEG